VEDRADGAERIRVLVENVEQNIGLHVVVKA
jgi:hypothetical protein